MRPVPLLGWVFALSVSAIAAGTAGTATTSRAEPLAALLPAVDPAWKARGWTAVMPHAYVLRKLLAVRTSPSPNAPAAFHLKGGARVPVLEQGERWWRIGWTDGRTGWVRAADVEPHASVVLIDLRTGRMVRRIAAKGQWGAVSDGTSLWSLADTGLTRTQLGSRPVFWSKAVAADRDAMLPEWSLWNPGRSHFYFRTAGSSDGALLRTEIRTGEVRQLGTPPHGELAGLTPSGAVIVDGEGDKARAHVYTPERKRTLGHLNGDVTAVTQSGVTFLTQDTRLTRADSQLRPTGHVRLPQPIQSVCLSADDGYVAAAYESEPDEGDLRVHVRIFDARTLRSLVRLTLPADTHNPYLRQVGRWNGGWWVAAGGEGQSELVARFRKDGRYLNSREGTAPTAGSADGKYVFLTDEHGILAVEPATGRQKVWPYTWRRTLPAHYLPKPTAPDFPTHLQISALTVTPDGRTLVLTEWLNGDPAG